jgi:2-amino-4-hydroxy-6-hydroxymethyldihydropteridine diphosphokinase
MATTTFILSGSNVGDREKYLARALELLGEIDGLEIVAVSALYVSEAQEMVGENPSFLNQAIMADYQYRPQELLDALEAIEKKLGRTDKGLKKPRSVDLDILIFGDQQIKTEKLVVPHPKLLKRPFAMVPLLQIEPDLIHPVKKEPVAGFLKESDRKQVVLFKDHVARAV